MTNKELIEIANMELRDQLEAERVKLETAIKCLKQYADEKNWYNIYDDESASWEPLWRHRQWKEEFGYKLAQKTLKELGYVKKA